jgi:hypothetical protein
VTIQQNPEELSAAEGKVPDENIAHEALDTVVLLGLVKIILAPPSIEYAHVA